MFSLANVNLERETAIVTWSRPCMEILEMEKNSYLCCLCQVPGNLSCSLRSGRAYGSSEWEKEGERGRLRESKWFWWKINGPLGEQRGDLHLWPRLSGCAIWFIWPWPCLSGCAAHEGLLSRDESPSFLADETSGEKGLWQVSSFFFWGQGEDLFLVG